MKKGKIDLTRYKLPKHQLVTTTHKVDVYYPDNGDRKNSPLFRRTRRKLIVKDKVPCWICGTYEDLEAHHFHVQWAFAEGVDWEKMRELHPGFDWSTFTKPEDFVDSEYNMLVLCQLHHRGPDHGIHAMPYPIWVMQRYKRADYVLLLEDHPELSDKDD